MSSIVTLSHRREGFVTLSQVNNKAEAKRLAFFIFYNILGSGMTRPFIVPRDLEAFFDNAEEVIRVDDNIKGLGGRSSAGSRSRVWQGKGHICLVGSWSDAWKGIHVVWSNMLACLSRVMSVGS